MINRYAENLPTGEGTTPYLPNSTFSYKEGDLSTGLVIEDADNNEYVWVEVPTTIYENTDYNSNGTKKPSNSENYENIEACLKAYTSDYSDSSYSDTNSDFTTQYQAMLKSVYTNGGFWIGRYEAGLDGENPRTEHTEITVSDKAVIKQNKIPYNWVTRDEAQILAERMNYKNCTSSLIFGLQWDLTLKYIETKKSTTKENLLSDSTSIGNYNNNLWNITNENAKYSTDYGISFTTGKYTKTSEESILLTTGADRSFSLMNIYDIAGNLWEWTLEFYNTSNDCVLRGGSYSSDVSTTPANSRNNDDSNGLYVSLGFRIGLWK